MIHRQDADVDPAVDHPDLDFIWRCDEKFEASGGRRLVETAQALNQRRGGIGDRIVDDADGQFADQLAMRIVNVVAEFVHGRK